MGIQRLTAKDNILVKQCDELFIKFLDSEGKYDENYLKSENVKSFLNDLEDENNILLVKKRFRQSNWLFIWIYSEDKR